MEYKNLIKKYAKYLENAKIKISPHAYLVLSIIISFIFAFAVNLMLISLKVPSSIADVFVSAKIILPILTFILLLDLTISYPYLRYKRRIEEIETHMPDALKQMANVLKAGATYELALKEASLAEYGALKEELELALRKLEEGENFENALKSISQNVDSKLVNRTITIIIDSIKAGAPLAAILEDIAEDAREANRVSRERKARTLMQAMFIFATSALIAPYIFGVANSLIKIFTISARGFEVSASIIAQSLAASQQISLMLEFYIFILALASSIMLSLMRENKIEKTLFYFPIILALAFIIYYASRIITSLLLIGGMV